MSPFGEVDVSDMTYDAICETFDEVYRTYGATVYRICLSYLRSACDAEDALQDVFCKYMSKQPSFKSEEHRKAWLIKVAVNRSKDVLRRKKREAAFGYSDEVNEQTADTEENFGVLEKIFALPEKYKEVFVLHYLENVSVLQISELLGISSSAVKMRLMRGREALKDVLQKEGVEL